VKKVGFLVPWLSLESLGSRQLARLVRALKQAQTENACVLLLSCGARRAALERDIIITQKILRWKVRSDISCRAVEGST